MKGIAKKMDTMTDSEKEQMFSQMSKNFAGKSNKENRVFLTEVLKMAPQTRRKLINSIKHNARYKL